MPWIEEDFLYSFTLLKGMATYRWRPRGFSRWVECEGYLDLKAKAEDRGAISLLCSILDFERAVLALPSDEEKACICLSAWGFEGQKIAKLLHKSPFWVSKTIEKALEKMKASLNKSDALDFC
ncbi:MAG: hypothetical protein AB1466_00015 [Actinomycetota bacterium]